MCITGRHNDPANRDGKASDKADVNIPSIDELLAFSSKGILKGYQNSEKTPQPLAPASNTSGGYLGPNQSKLDDCVSNSQGTRGVRVGSLLLR
jgi:hypothetical protein